MVSCPRKRASRLGGRRARRSVWIPAFAGMTAPMHRLPQPARELNNRHGDETGSGRTIALSGRVRLRIGAFVAIYVQAEGDVELSPRKGTAVAALSRRACPAALSQWRGALHRLQA